MLQGENSSNLTPANQLGLYHRKMVPGGIEGERRTLADAVTRAGCRVALGVRDPPAAGSGRLASVLVPFRSTSVSEFG
jgi:hypothetical protein